MKRFTAVLVTILVGMLLVTASAQTGPQLPTSRFMRDVMANKLNAIVVDCPSAVVTATACYYNEYHDVGMARLAIERFVNDYSDLSWKSPWEQFSRTVSRYLLFRRDTGATEVYLIAISRAGDYHSYVWVEHTAEFDY
jgi:hypothetical protein